MMVQYNARQCHENHKLQAFVRIGDVTETSCKISICMFFQFFLGRQINVGRPLQCANSSKTIWNDSYTKEKSWVELVATISENHQIILIYSQLVALTSKCRIILWKTPDVVDSVLMIDSQLTYTDK